MPTRGATRWWATAKASISLQVSCVSYEEEDTCVSYEEEDTCVWATANASMKHMCVGYCQCLNETHVCGLLPNFIAGFIAASSP